MTKHHRRWRAAGLGALLVCALSLSHSQFSEQILRVTVGDRAPGSPLRVSAEFSSVSGVSAVDLSWRFLGQATYTRREMQLIGNTAVYEIPETELREAILEYYLTVSAGDSVFTYPAENPTTQPLTANLTAAPGEARGSGLTVLSPEPGEHVNREEFLISFAVTDTAVGPEGVMIYLDDADLTTAAVPSDNLYVVRPATAGIAVDGGPHTIRVVLLDSTGSVRSEMSWKILVRGPRLTKPAPTQERHDWETVSDVRLETRHETIGEVNTPFNRGTVNVRATDGLFNVRGLLHLTNEEKETRQPQHRFFIGAESPWATLGYGDVYPVLPDMIITGKRVRGLSGAVTAGFFDFDVVAGQALRAIAGDTIKTFPKDSLVAEQISDPGAAYGPWDTTTVPETWAKYRYGTFDRSMLILRPSFAVGPAVLGISGLHSKDDPGSIQYGIAPAENAVGGADLLLSFDERNVEFKAQAAFSMLNTDISGGTITDDRIDSIFGDGTYEDVSPEDVRDARDIFDRFVTVNEHFVPLGTEGSPTLSYEGTVALNYRPNNFLFTWMRHGASFVSFGQPFYRSDLEGFSLSDRVSLLDNRLRVALGVERLEDNTASTKPATTTNTNVSGSVSYITRSEIPNVTIGIASLNNRNPVDPASFYHVKDRTVRIYGQLSRQIMLGAMHFASLSLSTSKRDDMTTRNYDSRNTSAGFTNVTTFGPHLQTTFSALYFYSRILQNGESAILDYTIFLAGAQYTTLGERLRLAGAISPTIGGISRTLVDAGATWFFMEKVSLEGRLDLYFNKDAGEDVVWSFIVRAGL